MKHILTVLLALVVPAHADIIYVDSNASPGGAGTSWQNAHQGLQDALLRADLTPGPDQVCVAEGSYSPGALLGDRFNIPRHTTVVGGYRSGDHWRFPTGSMYATVLTGNGICQIVVVIQNYGSSVKLKSVVVSGGIRGIWLDGGPFATTTLEDVRVQNCHGGQGISAGNSGGTLNLLRVEVMDCSASAAGYTGGIRVGSTDRTSLCNVIVRNCTSDTGVGGMHLFVAGDGEIVGQNILIHGCRGKSTGGLRAEIGGIPGSISMYGVTLVDNQATSTINPRHALGSENIVSVPGHMEFVNMVVWSGFQGPEMFGGYFLHTYFMHSLVRGGLPAFFYPNGTQTLLVPPQLMKGSYIPTDGSPVRDAGGTGTQMRAAAPDVFDLDNDGNRAEDCPVDLLGNPRFVGAAIDLGCYEIQ